MRIRIRNTAATLYTVSTFFLVSLFSFVRPPMLLPVLLGAAQPSAKLAMLVAGMKSASQGSGRMILQTRPVKSKSFYFRSG
jgi:hypothetical protein